MSAVPSSATPSVDDGSVQGIAEIGSTMVIGGTFTSVGGQARNYLAAFDKVGGALSVRFNPEPNGQVLDVLPGPTPGTVYAVGRFSRIGGAPASRIALLDAQTGAQVPGFNGPQINAAINTVARHGNRLIIGGIFTTVGGVAHGGLAALDATTGALDPATDLHVTENHNASGSGAIGTVGVKDVDISPDGEHIIVIGNFRKVNGLDRDQIAMLHASGSSIVVRPDWRTLRYTPLCFSSMFDSYIRGVSFSPDGSYFVVAATGSHSLGSRCDAAARFETADRSDQIQPSWVAYSGGDTLWSVAVTEQAVYVGGHQKFMNNPNGYNYAGQGAVTRAGLAALDPRTGIPLSWNPGRNPRGAAVYVLLPTADGLWMGSDTEWIGNYQYKRPRLAFFPLATGARLAPEPGCTCRPPSIAPTPVPAPTASSAWT